MFLNNESLLFLNPFVSIAVLAYNRPHGLERTLNCLVSQSYTNLEILISDDCSRDPQVQEVVDKYVQLDSRVVCYKQRKNIGIIGNHVFLQERVKGKYMMWACDDDWWHKDFVSSCVSELENDDELVLCTTNSTMVKNKVFIAPNEYVDTRSINEPVKRLLAITKEIQWNNHAFYGVMRTSVAKPILFKNRLGFDLNFIFELSLLGKFAQLPNYYFRKTIGGNGANLQSNLEAIKHKGIAYKMAPGFVFSMLSLKDFLLDYSVPLTHKLFNLKAYFLVLRAKDPFPRQSKSLWKKVKELPTRYHDKINYKKSLRLTNNHELTLLLFRLSISARDVDYDTKSGELKLRLIGVKLKFPEQKDLLLGYNDYIQAKYQHDITFTQEEENRVLVQYNYLKIWLQSSNSFYAFKEVFIKQCYNLDLSQSTVVFDVGMNVGYTSLFFAQKEMVKVVYGFELIPFTASIAQFNLDLNPEFSKKIILNNFGLSDSDHSFEMEYSEDQNGMNGIGEKDFSFYGVGKNELKKTEVTIKKSSLVLKPLINRHSSDFKVLKIDVEGSEYAIIRDLAENNLIECFDAIMIEWHNNGPDVLLESLWLSGFQIFFQNEAHSSLAFNTGMIYAIRQ